MFPSKKSGKKPTQICIKVTSRAKHKLHTENNKKAPPEQMQAPPEHVDANFQILAHLF
jgi:hypothetical protein